MTSRTQHLVMPSIPRMTRKEERMLGMYTCICEPCKIEFDVEVTYVAPGQEEPTLVCEQCYQECTSFSKMV